MDEDRHVSFDGISTLIKTHGGPTAVSRKTPVPLRTLEDWQAGRGPRSGWVKLLLRHWLESPPDDLAGVRNELGRQDEASSI